MKMQGNTILVAGGVSGIGRGLAELLCRLGNEVLIFGAPPQAMAAMVRTNPGMQAIELDLADPWAVDGLAGRIGAAHPALNMLVNVSIAFPLKYLPGMHALLQGDDTAAMLEAQRLGVRQLVGALLPQLRKRPHGAVVNVSAGPSLAPPMAPSVRDVMEGCASACTLAVRKRWATACVEVMAVGGAPRAGREVPAPTAATRRAAPDLPLAGFVSGVAHVLAEGLHEDAALARLAALWPAPGAPATVRRDDLAAEPS
jgi:uncharacterized oxidoreductase